jgi:hypothetical protein
MALRSFSRRARLAVVALLAAVPVVAACTPTSAASTGNPTDYSTNFAGGQRLRWNPCAVVHWRADVRNAPATALSEVRTAVATLSAKTGITYVYDGPASYIPQQGGFASQPAPLVVSFGRAPGRPSASNYLSGGSNVGYGGYQAVGTSVNGKVTYQIKRGFVVIDADRYPFMSGKIKAGLLLHELGHATGLNHAKYTTELMYPTISNSSPNGYSSGDLAGLRLLGRSAGCI